jgi:hypothetical protein
LSFCICWRCSTQFCLYLFHISLIPIILNSFRIPSLCSLSRHELLTTSSQLPQFYSLPLCDDPCFASVKQCRPRDVYSKSKPGSRVAWCISQSVKIRQQETKHRLTHLYSKFSPSGLFLKLVCLYTIELPQAQPTGNVSPTTAHCGSP